MISGSGPIAQGAALAYEEPFRRGSTFSTAPPSRFSTTDTFGEEIIEEMDSSSGFGDVIASVHAHNGLQDIPIPSPGGSSLPPTKGIVVGINKYIYVCARARVRVSACVQVCETLGH